MTPNDSDALIIAKRAIEAVSILIDRVEILENEIERMKSVGNNKSKCSIIEFPQRMKSTASKK